MPSWRNRHRYSRQMATTGMSDKECVGTCHLSFSCWTLHPHFPQSERQKTGDEFAQERNGGEKKEDRGPGCPPRGEQPLEKSLLGEGAHGLNETRRDFPLSLDGGQIAEAHLAGLQGL